LGSEGELNLFQGTAIWKGVSDEVSLDLVAVEPLRYESGMRGESDSARVNLIGHSPHRIFRQAFSLVPKKLNQLPSLDHKWAMGHFAIQGEGPGDGSEGDLRIEKDLIGEVSGELSVSGMSDDS
jgi:hypothetical protein